MPQASTNSELVDYYRQRINDVLSGKVVIPETRYERTLDPNEIHASEIDGLCLIRGYYNRTLDEIPPLSGDSPLHFLRGRAIERVLITKQSPIVVEGISMEIDDCVEPWGIIEIKSTASDAQKFEPITKYPHWINRGAMYCKGHGVEHFNLLVFFLVGDMWTKKTKSVDLRAWKIEFSHDEIRHLWGAAQARREILLEAISKGTPPNILPQKWECKGCNFSIVCAHFNGNMQ